MKGSIAFVVVVVVVILVGLFGSNTASMFNVGADIDTLQLVQVIFRHGDRAPTNTYPNDPINKDPTAWPEGLAQLTSIGKMQQYNLGKYLRRRYGGFLADKYHSQELYVVSSDMDRTIMSVESNLAGLFPPVHKWHPNLDWQPIPLRTIPWKEDEYLHVNVKCHKYDQLHHDFLQHSEVVLAVNEENRDFVADLSDKSGIKASTVKEIISLQDIILAEWIHNLTIPGWAINALPRLNSLQAQVNTWGTYTDAMKRLRGGPLLELLIKNMLAKTGALRSSSPEERVMVVGGGSRKMLLYSAHDSTLARIMNTIGVFHPHNPPYASAFLMELHWDKEQTDHFVKVLYHNETGRAPYELEIPTCTSPCFLKDLIKATEHLIPRDMKLECAVEGDGEWEDQSEGLNLLRMSAPVQYNEGTSKLESTPTEGTMKSGSCTSTTYLDPLAIAIVGTILLLSCILLWLCLFKFFGCGCNSGGKNDWRCQRGSNYYERL